MARAEIDWTRLPGRRWLATVWRPGERERDLRAWEMLRQANSAVRVGQGAALSGISCRCPCCGQMRGSATASILGNLFGTGLF